MKHHFYNISVIIILSLIPFVSNYSQWLKSYIDNYLRTANQISVADINLDGKLDIVISAEYANQVVWYENPDWEKHLIGYNLTGVIGVATADIDGDDTVDVVACGYGANDVVWYENNHPTWTEHTIDNNFVDAVIPAVGDVNGDGNLDVIVNGWKHSELVWYENNDLQWNRNLITNATSSWFGNVYAIDIDKNGNIDIFATRGDSLNSYESQDNGASWIRTTIDDNLKGAWDCFAGYINDDNNLDIIGIGGGHENNGGGLVWYNKTDSIWIKNQIDNEYKNYACVLDFDGDGKNDIATTDNHKVNLYKNNLPNGWEKTVIDSNLSWAWHIKSADIDEDGLSDLIVSDWDGNKLIFYKNLSNMAYATSIELTDLFFHPQGDTVTLNATLENPEGHSAEVYAIINGDKDSYQDSIQLFDDGLHGDKDASDNIWGEEWLPNIPEDMYTVSLYVNDLTRGKDYSSPFESRFTTKGPIVFEKLEFTDLDPIPNPGDRVKFSITLKNLGVTDTVYNVEVKMLLNDSTMQNATTGRPLFGDIAPGESMTNVSRDFGLLFRAGGDSTSVGLHEIGLELSSNGEVFWYDTFTIDVLTGMEDISVSLPIEFSLTQNYPNPFNPTTKISYSIPEQSHVSLKAFDVLGREVAVLVNEEQPPGNYEVEFDASNLTSGIYFYRIRAGAFVESKKMVLMK